MRRGSGFTLLEVITVLAILLLIASLLFPVFVSARRAAKIGVTTSNLRQIYLATEIYRNDNDGSPFGDATAMGLPPWPQSDALPILDELRPPEAPHAASPQVGVQYWHYYVGPEDDGLVPTWKDYTLQWNGSAMIYADPFFNPPNVPLDRGDLFERFVVGIALDGGVRRKKAKGDWMMRSWWHI